MIEDDPKPDTVSPETKTEPEPSENAESAGRSGEVGGPKGPEPTRFGDWEKKGRCIDF